MASSFTVPEVAYEGFIDLIDIGAEKLGRLAEEATNRDLTFDVETLAQDLSASIDFDAKRITQVISSVLIPLCSLRAVLRQPPDEFLKRLEEVIKDERPDWLKKNKAGWKNVVPAVSRLIAPGGYFSHLRKAFMLVYKRPSVVNDVKVLTELRPVYDDNITDTKAMVLTSTLVIDYDDGGDTRQMHLTLDQGGMELLQEELDRAKKKVRLLEEQAERLKVPVLIAGAE